MNNQHPPLFRSPVPDASERESPTDADLVRRVQQGDDTAQATLIERWSVRVLAMCRARIADHQAAEDTAQNALLCVCQSLFTLRDPLRFAAWTRQITLNACRDWYRHRDGAAKVMVSPSAEAVVDSDPMEQDETERLTAAVDQLPETQREIVYLFYFDQLTYDEIAALLGLARSTVCARLSAARTALRKRLVTSTDDLMAIPTTPLRSTQRNSR